MKIGVDLRPLDNPRSVNRGIGRYLTELLRALSQSDHRNEYILVTTSLNAEDIPIKLSTKFKFLVKQCNPKRMRDVKYVRALTVSNPAIDVDSLGCDVFFQPDIAFPVKSKQTPIVAVLYDLIPYLQKKRYQRAILRGWGVRSLLGYIHDKEFWHEYRRQVRGYAAKDFVIAISEASKKDLIETIPAVELNKVKAIPLAAGMLSGATTKDDSFERTVSALKPFIFYAGGVDPRKGVETLVDAFNEVRNSGDSLHLILGGKEFEDEKIEQTHKIIKLINSSKYKSSIKIMGYVSDSQLKYLYENAEAFIFPSQYEGFGLQVLEAMQAGCPVIAYNNSSIPEVAGSAAILLNRHDSLSKAIRRLVRDKRLQKELAAKGKKQAGKFSWGKTANETLNVLEKAAQQA